MMPEQFQIIYPRISGWIRQTLAGYAEQARAAPSAGFARLPLYFSPGLLQSAKFVVVEQLPMPPLTTLGLGQFEDFLQGDYDGITYLDTFFVRCHRADDEGLYFHELIHVVQWRLLGPERFLAAYADGHKRFGYHKNPLEVMAYDAEATFRQSSQSFNAEKLVAEQLRGIRQSANGL